jgi:hypothetical protein
MKEARKPRAFRPWPENEVRLEYAQTVGIDVSELINELLRDSLKPRIEKKLKSIRETVAQPVP